MMQQEVKKEGELLRNLCSFSYWILRLARAQMRRRGATALCIIVVKAFSRASPLKKKRCAQKSFQQKLLGKKWELLVIVID